jgi:hypothetical protein
MEDRQAALSVFAALRRDKYLPYGTPNGGRRLNYLVVSREEIDSSGNLRCDLVNIGINDGNNRRK